MFEKSVQLKNKVIKGQLKELVQDSAGENLMRCWKPRPRSWPRLHGMSVINNGKDTEAALQPKSHHQLWKCQPKGAQAQIDFLWDRCHWTVLRPEKLRERGS